jgi:hypothetical protein
VGCMDGWWLRGGAVITACLMRMRTDDLCCRCRWCRRRRRSCCVRCCCCLCCCWCVRRCVYSRLSLLVIPFPAPAAGKLFSSSDRGLDLSPKNGVLDDVLHSLAVCHDALSITTTDRARRSCYIAQTWLSYGHRRAALPLSWIRMTLRRERLLVSISWCCLAAVTVSSVVLVVSA